MSITLLGSHLLIEETEVNCYLVRIQASQRLAEDDKANFHLVVFQASQKSIEDYEIKLLSGCTPGFTVTQTVIWSESRLQ